MVKLIMTDIDGTLIPDGTMDINPEYFEVIERNHIRCCIRQTYE